MCVMLESPERSVNAINVTVNQQYLLDGLLQPFVMAMKWKRYRRMHMDVITRLVNWSCLFISR